MKRIIMNLGIFKNVIVKTLATLFSVSSAILLFVDKKDLGIDSTCKGIITLCGIGIFAVIVGWFFVYNYRKKIIFENVQGKLTVRYDDISLYVCISVQRRCDIGIDTSSALCF